MKKTYFTLIYPLILIPVIFGFFSCTKEDFKTDNELSNRQIVLPEAGDAPGYGWSPLPDNESTERKPRK